MLLSEETVWPLRPPLSICTSVWPVGTAISAGTKLNLYMVPVWMSLKITPGLALSPDTETHRFSAYRLVTSLRHWAETSQLVHPTEQENKLMYHSAWFPVAETDLNHKPASHHGGTLNWNNCSNLNMLNYHAKKEPYKNLMVWGVGCLNKCGTATVYLVEFCF